jgi:hypothetical protein
MAGMRDRRVHDYFGVDYKLVWDVVQNRIPNSDARYPRCSGPNTASCGTRRRSGIEELTRERAASTIDMALVEEGIELGKKKMMVEMVTIKAGLTARLYEEGW